MSKINWILSERNEGDLKNMQDEMNRLMGQFEQEWWKPIDQDQEYIERETEKGGRYDWK